MLETFLSNWLSASLTNPLRRANNLASTLEAGWSFSFSSARAIQSPRRQRSRGAFLPFPLSHRQKPLLCILECSPPLPGVLGAGKEWEWEIWLPPFAWFRQIGVNAQSAPRQLKGCQRSRRKNGNRHDRTELLARKAGRCMLANARWPCFEFILGII